MTVVLCTEMAARQNLEFLVQEEERRTKQLQKQLFGTKYNTSAL